MVAGILRQRGCRLGWGTVEYAEECLPYIAIVRDALESSICPVDRICTLNIYGVLSRNLEVAMGTGDCCFYQRLTHLDIDLGMRLDRIGDDHRWHHRCGYLRGEIGSPMPILYDFGEDFGDVPYLRRIVGCFWEEFCELRLSRGETAWPWRSPASSLIVGTAISWTECKSDAY